jgi:hypothetical protein
MVKELAMSKMISLGRSCKNVMAEGALHVALIRGAEKTWDMLIAFVI